MKEINDGGSAFPLPTVYNEIQGLKYTYETGMSLRDWFAGQALAMLADPNISGKPGLIAKGCYEIADAMLLERDKK